MNPLSSLIICLFLGLTSISFGQKFETEGVIHSSEGGIMFPDKSLQKTAAYNMNSALAGDIRGIGFLHIDDYETDIDSSRYTDLIPIIDFELASEILNIESPRTGGLPEFKTAKVTFNLGPWSPKIWKDYAQGKSHVSIDVHLTNPLLPMSLFYFEYNFDVARIVSVKDEMVHLGNSKFAHLQTIEFTFDVIKWTHRTEAGQVSTSYNIETNE